jgi:hypothetical protein
MLIKSLVDRKFDISNVPEGTIVQSILTYLKNSKLVRSDLKKIKISKAFIDEKLKTTSYIITDSEKQYHSILSKINILHAKNDELLRNLRSKL